MYIRALYPYKLCTFMNPHWEHLQPLYSWSGYWPGSGHWNRVTFEIWNFWTCHELLPLYINYRGTGYKFNRSV